MELGALSARHQIKVESAFPAHLVHRYLLSWDRVPLPLGRESILGKSGIKNRMEFNFILPLKSSPQVTGASLLAQIVKNPPATQGIWILSLSWEDPLEKGMATHSSFLAWKIPSTEEPGGL